MKFRSRKVDLELDFQWQSIVDRAERDVRLPEWHDHMRHAADVACPGIQAMRQQPRCHLPRAVRRRHGFRQSPADDSTRGVLPRDGHQGVESVQREDTGPPVPRQRRSVLRPHFQRRRPVFLRPPGVNLSDWLISKNRVFFWTAHRHAALDTVEEGRRRAGDRGGERERASSAFEHKIGRILHTLVDFFAFVRYDLQKSNARSPLDTEWNAIDNGRDNTDNNALRDKLLCVQSLSIAI